MRIHRYCAERKRPCRIRFISDSVCWTEVPESARVLRRQRIRWQRGCLECLLFHKRLLGNRRFGAVGLIGLPYFFTCEVIGPLAEVFGYLFTLAGLLSGRLALSSALLFFAVSVLFGLLLSVGSVLLEESLISKYPNPRDLARLLLAGFIENLGYRQLTLLWRVQAILHVLFRKERSWGEMERRGFQRG